MSDRIDYRITCDSIAAEHLEGFFVGWPNPPSPETHFRILQCSSEIVLAILPDTGKVIGFINALTDGILTAYIPLLEVLPEYQGKGIGSELVLRMIGRLDGLYTIDILCDPSVQPFYRRLGFTSEHGMALRNFDHQCGRPATSDQPEANST